MTRFNNCRGFKLLKWGKWQVELWFCPKNEVIPPHTHTSIESRIVYVAGRLLFTREDRSCEMNGWKSRLRTIKVHPNQVHSAKVTGNYGVFLNIEHWTTEPSSAAIDFHAS